MKNLLTISTFICTQVVMLLLTASTMQSQQRRTQTGGHIAVVVDERLSALRSTPELAGNLVQRVRRGRLVTILGSKKGADGVKFYRVRLTRRTRGWIQKEAVVSAMVPSDDQALLRLILASEDFERIACASIFLDTFPKSKLRPEVLSLLAEACEAVAAKLSHDAVRRLGPQLLLRPAPEYSYFLNYTGLDRYNRQGIKFVFDRASRQFYYDGTAWREIVRRYPESAAANEARKRLKQLER